MPFIRRNDCSCSDCFQSNMTQIRTFWNILWSDFRVVCWYNRKSQSESFDRFCSYNFAYVFKITRVWSDICFTIGKRPMCKMFIVYVMTMSPLSCVCHDDVVAIHRSFFTTQAAFMRFSCFLQPFSVSVKCVTILDVSLERYPIIQLKWHQRWFRCMRRFWCE